MSLLERTVTLLNGMPENKIAMVYDFAVSVNDPDVQPVHDEDDDCPLCRIYRYPNAETLEAMAEVDEMIRTGTGQHFSGTTEEFFSKILEG